MKKFLCILLSLTMMFSVLPMTANATEGDTTGTDGTITGSGLHLDKKATLNADGTYTITLEAYAESEQQTVYTPMDILFVLDQSGSMLQVDDTSQNVYVDGNGNGAIEASATINGNFATGGVDISGDGKVDDSDKSIKITGLGVSSSGAQYFTRSSENTFSKITDTSTLFTNASIAGYYINATSTMIDIWNTFYPAILSRTSSETWKNAKIAKYENNRYYSIKDNDGKITYQNTESDFVLAKTRYGVLTDVTTKFINDVHDLASTNSTDHRMALVGFSGDSANNYDGTALYITSEKTLEDGKKTGSWDEYSYNNSEIKNQYANAFRSVKNDNFFLNTMREYKAFAQYTRQDLGLTMANKVFDKVNYESPENKNRKKIVIFITDGSPAPGTVTTDEKKMDSKEGSIENVSSNSSLSGNNLAVANKAIEQANILKGKGVEIYSIGIFPSNVSNEANTELMKRVSSDMPYTDSLVYMTDKAEGELKTNSTKYCHVVTAGADLQDKLTQIFNEITGSVAASSTTLTSSAILKDIISDDFTLPEGFDVTDPSDITVQTSDYKGNEEWEDPKTFDSADVKLGSDTGTEDGVKNTITVTGFDYADNFVSNEGRDEGADDGDESNNTFYGRKLIVTINGVLAKDSAAKDKATTTNKKESGIYESSASTSPAAPFPQPGTVITNKTYVLDFGKPVEVNAKDWKMNTGIIDISDASKSRVIALDSSKIRGTVDSTYGKTVMGIKGSGEEQEYILTYTPQTMEWSGYDSIYVLGTTNDENITSTSGNANGKLWARVDFIPATNVYYEDSFETNDADGVSGIEYSPGWTIENYGTVGGANQSSANTIYGFDEAYDGNLGDSDGSSHMAASGKTAKFTFTGTGVDIYTRTNAASGQVLVQAKSYGEDGTTVKKIYTALVDNQFTSTDGGLYQIPTVALHDMDYDTYEVTITVLSDKTGNSTYYLDAIRIFNSINEEEADETVSDAYTDAKEDNAITAEVRDYIIDPAAEDIDAEFESLEGAVYIDKLSGSTENIVTYKDLGPKNEVYLEKNKSIAFEIETLYQGKALLGIKAPSGTASTVSVNYSDIVIDSATDMYYEITPNNGMVVITNTSDALISITKLRLTEVGEAAQTLSLRTTRALMEYVSSFAPEEPEETVENPFTDVAEDDYYYEAVLWAVENGITNGVSSTEFGAGQTCSRAQAVTFLWRANDCPEPETTETSFTDVDVDSYYYKAMLWAVENGITSGTGATTFSPDASVTRGQFVTFLHRAEGKPESDIESPFTDVAEDSFYYDAVLWAVENGITSGTGESKFNPDAECTREQIVTFLWRAMH